MFSQKYGKFFATCRKYMLLLMIGICIYGMIGMIHREVLQRGIAEEVLRFHVIANSNSTKDQAVKLLVRDTVLEWAQQHEMQQKQDAVCFLRDHLSEIEAEASAVLSRNGFSYGAAARLSTCYFPDRTYGACTFPAGWYDALRIELGEARGKNWWCVFFPKLCFADYLHAVVGEKEMEALEKVLTVEEYEALFRDPSKWKIRWRWLKP